MIGEHVLAGYVNDAGGREALHLAASIAALTGGRLSVATVHPPSLPAAAGEARTLLEQASELLDDRPADLHVQEGRSVGRGLTVLASRIGADLIVVGSPEGGARGRIGIGAAADHLLHSATEAVMLAPSGHTPSDDLTRITVMYVRRPQCDDAVIRAAQASERLEIPLRLVTLAIGDAAGTEQLRDDLALAIRLALDSADLPPEDVSADLAEGDDVADALDDVDWQDGEILVCASSEDAAAHRVFLGEVALKVLRAAPCPVTVLPRGYF
ncbi:universal stress protein family protein [Actinomadura pelletieri DSM 43383]|uniref:Universal stress protein family protein n=1 Tax=Actinomadura pelletieri DSM 43383 TaxID=1120940 RepID=A0A495QKH0_9ACTN|nr:universal stress protein [Actinomadura pelletieri]RKS73024.1 universal stress protein family protein [Actinomadura pelletieri DSM 43383]